MSASEHTATVSGQNAKRPAEQALAELSRLNKRICRIVSKQKRLEGSNDGDGDGGALEISTDGPLTQDDVLAFQKQALYRLLHLQYRKNNVLMESLKIVSENQSKLAIYNSLLIQWWSQVADSLKTLFQVPESETLNDDILLALTCFKDDSEDNNNNNDNDLLRANLCKLHDGLIKLVTGITSAKYTPATNEDLKNSMFKAQSESAKITVRNDTLTSENSLLKKKIANLQDQIDTLVRSFDRVNSKTLQRIADVEKDSEDLKDSKNNSRSTSTVPAIVKEESMSATAVTSTGSTPATPCTTDNTVDKAELDELSLKLASSEGKNQAMQTQLEEKMTLISNLEKTIADLNTKLQNLDDEELTRISSRFRSLLEENKSLLEKLETVKFEKKKIESQMFELESKFSINKAKIEAKNTAELENNNNYITKLENDINRIRSDRDSLNAKVNVLKNEKGKTEVIENLTKLTDTLQNRIKELEEFQSLELSKLSADDHSKILINELKQIEQAFKSMREVSIAKLLKSSESETLINKLTIEKTKADEKYFQAMRLKDSLSSQNKILTSNLTKQMELIEILRSNEAELKKKLSIEDKIYANLSNIESMYNTELENLKQKLTKLERANLIKSELENDLRSQISKSQLEITNLNKKLQTTQQTLSAAQKQNEQYKSLLESARINPSAASSGPNATNSIAMSMTSDSEIQEALLSMTKCSLCNKNFKNVALKTCGHCFCKECVDDRLNARMRKCPTCNSQFSRYDVLSIHL